MANNQLPELSPLLRGKILVPVINKKTQDPYNDNLFETELWPGKKVYIYVYRNAYYLHCASMINALVPSKKGVKEATDFFKVQNGKPSNQMKTIQKHMEDEGRLSDYFYINLQLETPKVTKDPKKMYLRTGALPTNGKGWYIRDVEWLVVLFNEWVTKWEEVDLDLYPVTENSTESSTETIENSNENSTESSTETITESESDSEEEVKPEPDPEKVERNFKNLIVDTPSGQLDQLIGELNSLADLSGVTANDAVVRDLEKWSKEIKTLKLNQDILITGIKAYLQIMTKALENMEEEN